jgi:cytochrome c
VNIVSKRAHTKILLYTDKPATLLEEPLQQVAAKSGWAITKVMGAAYFGEDSLQGISSIVIPFSALNRLDHRAIASLKRYLEAGGGGVVAIKDTVHTQPGWPWLQKWNEWPADKELQQDLGRIIILPEGPSDESLQKALTYTSGNNTLPDYTKATTLALPDASRYTYTILSQGMDEPMQMALFPNNNVLIVERKGLLNSMMPGRSK